MIINIALLTVTDTRTFDNDPPMNASGTDDIRNGAIILGLIFPALI